MAKKKIPTEAEYFNNIPKEEEYFNALKKKDESIDSPSTSQSSPYQSILPKTDLSPEGGIDEPITEQPKTYPVVNKEEMKQMLPRIDEMIKNIDDKASLSVGENIHLFGFGKPQGDLLLARRTLNKAKRLIEAPDEGIMRQAMAGLRRKDLSDYLSLGTTEAYSSLKTANIVNKMNKGEELTDDETLVLSSRYLFDIVDANKDKSSAYNIGNAIGEVAPFIGQLVITKGIGTTAEQGAVNAGRQMLTKQAATVLKKYGLDDAVKTMAGASAQAPFMPMMWTRYGKERVGVLDVDENGKLIQAEGSTKGGALLESYGTTVSAIFSEKIGDVMRKNFGTIGGKLGEGAMSTKTMQAIKNFKKNAYWSGLGWEYFEEQVDMVGQAIASDDAKLSNILDVRQQFETLATLAVIGGGFKAVEQAGYLKDKTFKKEFEQVKEVFDEKIDGVTRREISHATDGDNVTDMYNRLKDVDMSHLTPLQQKVVYDYIGGKVRYKTLYSASQVKPEEGKEPPKETAPGITDPRTVPSIAEEKKITFEDLLGETGEESPEEIAAAKAAYAKFGNAENELEVKNEPLPPEEAKAPVIESNIEPKGNKIIEDSEILRIKGDNHLTNDDIFSMDATNTNWEGKPDPIRASDLLKRKNQVDKWLEKHGDSESERMQDKISDTETYRDAIDDILDERGFEWEWNVDKQANDYKLKQNAIQERGPEEISVGETPGNRQEVGGRIPEPERPAQKNGPYGESPKAPQEEIGGIKKILEAEEQKKLEKPKAGGIAGIRLFSGPKSKRLPQKSISQWFNANMQPAKGMPKSVHQIAIQTEANIAKRRYQIEISALDELDNAYTALGKKMTPEQKETISSVLENMGTTQSEVDNAMNTIGASLPKEMQAPLQRMRQMIDSYSEELKVRDMIGLGLEEKIGKNQGYYMTRTYKKHTDRNWTWETIPIKIKEDAAKVLKQKFPQATDDEILGKLKALIETPEIQNSVIKQGQSLGDIDKNTLKKRSQFLTDNPEVRALLGENREPFYNYAVSLTKMAEMIERGKMLENIKDSGLSEGWLSENESYDKNHIAKIKYNKGLYGGKEGVKQLGDYYTTPEIAEAISKYYEREHISNKFMRVYMKGITWVKKAKTIYSVKSNIRNFLSNPFNAVANGNFNIPQVGAELNNRLKTQGSIKEFVRELKTELFGHGIIGDNARVGEIVNNIKDLNDKLSYISTGDETGIGKAGRKIDDFALKTYAAGDDIWKTYRYISEYLRYSKVYEGKGMPKDEALTKAKKEAADILRKTQTYYSDLPTFIKNFRKIPVANTFISWPYLTFRNFLGTMQTGIKELKTPGFAHIGVQRLLGTGAAITALSLVAGYRNKENGVDDEQIEAWKRFLPKFWKNDIISAANPPKEGKLEYTNLSYMDYYNTITTPLLMLWNKYQANGEIKTEDAVDAAIEFGGKFVGYDILFDKITNLKSGVDRQTGKQIYNPNEEPLVIFGQAFEYLEDAFEPGTITDARRIYKTAREGGEWKRQLGGVFAGQQARTIDPIKSLTYYMLPKYKDEIENCRKIYKDELRRYNRLANPNDYDRGVLENARGRAENAIGKVVGDISEDYNAVIKIGIDPNEFTKSVKDAKFDADVRDAILYGYNIGINDEGQIIKIIKP